MGSPLPPTQKEQRLRERVGWWPLRLCYLRGRGEVGANFKKVGRDVVLFYLYSHSTQVKIISRDIKIVFCVQRN
jgi:hypothetical protein